jgi:hypothetical protein
MLSLPVQVLEVIGQADPSSRLEEDVSPSKALEAHWMKGAATAIYLEGHKDSLLRSIR